MADLRLAQALVQALDPLDTGPDEDEAWIVHADQLDDLVDVLTERGVVRVDPINDAELKRFAKALKAAECERGPLAAAMSLAAQGWRQVGSPPRSDSSRAS